VRNTFTYAPPCVGAYATGSESSPEPQSGLKTFTLVGVSEPCGLNLTNSIISGKDYLL
jgi:hypothetical protein